MLPEGRALLGQHQHLQAMKEGGGDEGQRAQKWETGVQVSMGVKCSHALSQAGWRTSGWHQACSTSLINFNSGRCCKSIIYRNLWTSIEIYRNL